MQPYLVAQNLRKTFVLSKKQQKIEKTNRPIKVAVNNLSFTVNSGEIYGLLGPNGAGKTTTLRMLSTLISPDSGTAVIGGVDLVKEPERVRQKIGFLTGELKLEDFFTPDYLFDFFAALHSIPPEKAQQRKNELFVKFGIDAFREVKVGNLSTGMKQKVSLIISIIHDPEFIIFDEPTNGLDVLTARVVTEFLQELKNEGKTILLSTHIFSLVEKLCDRVGIIINGNLVLEDDVSTLTKDCDMETAFFNLYYQTEGAQL
jgi:sodium transport system ATP-binding protein